MLLNLVNSHGNGKHAFQKALYLERERERKKNKNKKQHSMNNVLSNIFDFLLIPKKHKKCGHKNPQSIATPPHNTTILVLYTFLIADLLICKEHEL